MKIVKFKENNGKFYLGVGVFNYTNYNKHSAVFDCYEQTKTTLFNNIKTIYIKSSGRELEHYQGVFLEEDLIGVDGPVF